MPPPNSADPNAAKSQTIMNVGMIVVMFVVIWVVVLRPQQKRAKEQTNRLKSLKSGDRITFGTGMVGVVLTLKEHTLKVQCGDAKLEILKTAVTDVTAGDNAAGASN